MNWIGRLSNRNLIGDQQMAINLSSDIVNQYGQLIGEYSRLDDELWFSKPEEDDHDALARTQEGLESNFTPSYEYPVGEEKLSKYINNPVSDGGTTSVKETSSSLNYSSSDQSQTSFPVYVPRRRRSHFSTLKKKATKHAETEHDSRLDGTHEHRPSNLVRMRKVSDLLRSGFDKSCSWGEAVKKCTHCESTKTSQWREGPMGRETLCNSCSVQYKGGRLFSKYHTLDSNMEESRHWEREDDPNPKPTPRRKKPKVAVGKCMHCETTKTPQWREGPMGHKTLCNACGVQYKRGRLFPEYRPLHSPTFNPSLHSHLPKKVHQMRMAKNGEISVVSEDTVSSRSEVNE